MTRCYSSLTPDNKILLRYQQRDDTSLREGILLLEPTELFNGRRADALPLGWFEL